MSIDDKGEEEKEERAMYKNVRTTEYGMARVNLNDHNRHGTLCLGSKKGACEWNSHDASKQGKELRKEKK